MKSYTDLEQSKKLVEFLPPESADMAYLWHSTSDNPTWRYDEDMSPMVLGNVPINELTCDALPCWSTSALLEIIRNNGRYELQMYEGGYYFEANGFMTESYFSPVDACVEMILKLKENNLI